MTDSVDDLPWPALQRVRRSVVVVDMVESVRLMEANEEGTVRRWQQFVSEVTSDVLPAQRARLVKSLGDGMLCEFGDPAAAVSGALRMQEAAGRLNTGYAEDDAMCLRIGVHTADVIVDELDIYGSGVNLAARLGSLAGPGEIVVSAEVRDGLTHGLDAEIEDLGECFVKNREQPVHAYRVGPVGASPVIEQHLKPVDARPVVAVIPFRNRIDDPEHAVVGEVIADEVIAGLSRTAQLHVISRLSTSAFRDRDAGLPLLNNTLGARYVLSGAYLIVGGNVRLSVELADAAGQHIVWANTLAAPIASVLAGDDEMVPAIVAAVGAAICTHELQRASSAPLPTLDSCTLLLGATALMHRASAREFDRARALLEHLAERHRRQPQAHAWLGKWHVLRVVQGWTEDKRRETEHAQASVQRALDADPSCALALAIDGLIKAYLRKDLDAATVLYGRALECNPNESLAWLFTSTLHSYRGEGQRAGEAAERALRLSPLDPLRYFYDSLAATAFLSAGNYTGAIALAKRSMKVNRGHTSTYRALAIAQVLGDQVDDARQTIRELRALEPELTVQRFIDRYPGQVVDQVERYAEALRTAGLPSG